MRAFANLPLRSKLLLVMMLTSTAVLALAVTVFSVNEWLGLRGQARQDLETQAQILAFNLSSTVAFNDVARARNTLEVLRNHPQYELAGVFNEHGELLAGLTNGSPGSSLAWPRMLPVGVQPSAGRLAIYQPLVQEGEIVGTVYLQTASSEFDLTKARFRRYLELAAIVLLTCWLLAFTLAYRLERVVSGPILHLLATTREVTGHRDYSVRARSYGRDELGQLIEGFNEMLGEIQVRDAALRQARDDLELRVGERTVELQHEVVERRRIEAALADEKERLAVTLRSIADAVVATDREGRVALFNAVAERLTGWSAADATARVLSEVLRFEPSSTGPAVPDPVLQVLEGGGTTELGERILRNIHGAPPRRISSTGAPIRDRAGQIVGVVIVMRDITEQYRAAQEGLRTSKLESVGLLAGGIAHDFNNILTAILGNVSIARGQIPRESRVATALLAAEKACIRASDLTRQLLTFSAGGTPVKQTASLAEIIRETTSFVLHGSNIALDIALDDDLWPVEIDVGQISQVLHNLTLNALHAMPAGGRLTVRGSNVVVEVQPGQSLRPGRYVSLTVADTGRGIPPEHLARVFEPYFTTKQQGSGLGLATAYSIVRKHEGDISVQSEPGRGTTFQLRLAAVQGSVPSERETDALPLHGSGRILVMDDEQPIRQMLESMLCSLGYEVQTAPDGAEAVRLYRQARADHRPFDAVILDLTVPGGLGGRETLQALRTLDPLVRAIVSSGYSADPVLARHRDYGFAAMVAKPYRLEDLARTFRELLHGTGHSPPADPPR
jgi:PAS domain S-box-containing protein